MDKETLTQISKIVSEANNMLKSKGAGQALADAVHKGLEAIAESIGDLAEAIRERNEIEEKKYVAKG